MIDTSFNCHANGKLLLSGEYFVLDGALALATPTVFGQHFTVSPLDANSGRIEWSSLGKDGNPWFRGVFQLQNNISPSYSIEEATDSDIGERIAGILLSGVQMQPLLAQCPALKIETRLEFPVGWGLGSSSTLIHCFAQWLGANAYDLLENTFGGSGYDLACAGADGPVFYNRENGTPEIRPVKLDWPFKENLHFIYLENKQDSREGIWHYQNHRKGNLADSIDHISKLTKGLAETQDLTEFMSLIDEHESYVARLLDLARVKGHRFADFNGRIKSLGAWGGDFALAASQDDPVSVQQYFKGKGYPAVLSWKDLILERK